MPAMAIRLPRLLLLPLLAAIAGSAVAQDNDITIYRCTDAAGHLTVQDSPCAEDQTQQVRRMLQPTDPPPRAEPVAPADLQPTPESAPVVVARHAPRAMYECVRDDGSRYTSDDGEGNPRWISSGGDWSYDDGPRLRGSGIVYSRGQAASSSPTLQASARGAEGGGANQPRPSFRRTDSAPPPPPPPGHGHGHGHGHHRGYGFGGGGGMWVRDACHVLPQAETCDRLRDRREQIRKRAFNAQANERATLHVEERGINARLAEDCGGA
jgi:hypothetical protein